jgi:pimeloyl-ACP methyl ester carboxylesterase
LYRLNQLLALRIFKPPLPIPNRQDWPAFVLSIFHAHYEDWAREVVALRESGPLTLIGPLIDSSLNVSTARAHQLRTDPAVAQIGRWSFAATLASAALWPTPDVGDGFRQAQISTIPVVFVQGDWDAFTPVENTLQILPYFRNSRLILVHRGMHKGALTLLDENAELQQKLRDYLRSGNMRHLPVSVSRAVPHFLIPDFAPPEFSASPGRS